MDTDKAICILDAIIPIARLVPVAGGYLEAMLEVTKQICQSVSGVRSNREGYEQLASKVTQYASAVSKVVQSNPRFSPGSENNLDQERGGLMDAVSDLTNVFREVLEMVERKSKQGTNRKREPFSAVRQFGHEVLRKDDDAETLKKLEEKIEISLKVFNIGNDILGLDTLGIIESEIKTIATAQKAYAAAQEAHAATQMAQLGRIEDKIDKVAVDHSSEYDSIKRELEPVLAARFDWHGKPDGCLPQTRVQLLHQIRAWITNISASSPNLFVLTGLAGTGKTTVAQSVCIEFDRQRSTISFFVSRSFAERRNPENIVRTIAYQLAAQHPAVRSTVSNALRNGRDVMTRPLSEQVESLIMTPLRTLGSSTPRILLVIDALDECDKIASLEGGELIPLLVAGIRQLSGRVKLLVTSREEPEIMKMLKRLGLYTSESLVRLHNIETTVVGEDIRAFYAHHFRIISKSRKFKDLEAWPSKADLDLLVELTGKLFVYAAILLRVIKAPRVDPKKRLEEIIRPPSSSAVRSVFQPLDMLYLDMLIKAVSTEEDSSDEEVVRRVRKVVGTLVLLQSPLNVTALSELIGESTFLIQEDIDHLSAVLLIPENPDDPITIFHPSFRDYILIRCTDERFRVDRADHDGFLALCCLDVMNRYLKQDICNLGDPSIMNEDISDLEQRRNEHMPLELRYACEYWMAHISNEDHLNEALIRELIIYCKNHLFHWVEALSLLGNLSIAAIRLPIAIEWCKQHISLESSGIVALLEDAERVVTVYDAPIRAAALQLYSTVLAFMPACDLYLTGECEAIGITRLISKRLGGWSASRRTLEGHSSHVQCIAFSPDGTRIASGSKDKTVRVWDAITGHELAQLNGHTKEVLSIAFSHGGTRIISGSWDNTVRMWDAITGCELARFDRKLPEEESFSLSPDGICIATGSDDNTVRVWDAVTGRELVQLHGHTWMVQSIAFSPDGTRIATGSRDKTVRVWDVVTGRELVQFRGHSSRVHCVAFSFDGTCVASGSWDNTVWAWDAVTGHKLAQLRGHTTTVQCVAFSPDGTRIASGSRDKTVRVWDVVTGRELAQLRGHTSAVQSVVFSPDGTRIASGSWDKTVRVWDAVASGELSQVDGYTSTVQCVAFSPDGTCVASGSEDKIIRVWDAVTGQELVQLRGHTSTVQCVAFSPDGTRIVSGSRDNTMRVWDAITGRELSQLLGHSWVVQCVAFSPDGTCVASGSRDKTVRVWDVDTGSELARLGGHTSAVQSVAFSPDGIYISTGSEDNIMRLWDVVADRELARFGESASIKRPVTFLSDGTRIATGSETDFFTSRWEYTQPDEHTEGVNSVAFSPDGTRIASVGSWNNTAWVWDAVTGRKLIQLDGHTSTVQCIAFSPDGARIATGSKDKTVRVWDAVVGCELARLDQKIPEEEAVALSRYTRHSISSSQDSTLHISNFYHQRYHKYARDFINSGPVVSVAFNKVGSQIISKDYYGEHRVWHAGTDFPMSSSHTFPVPHKSLAVPSALTVTFSNQSGWLSVEQLQGNGSKCLCWIPPERRGRIWICNDLIVLGSDAGVVTMLSIPYRQLPVL